MYRRILIPVDGSACARQGLLEVRKIAGDRPREVMLVHVIEIPAWHTDLREGTVGTIIIDTLRTSGRTVLETSARFLEEESIPAEQTLLETDGNRVAEQIVQCAREWHADLIVMGSHGRRGIGRIVLGSDAADVVRTAPCPVLLVRGEP